MKCLNEIVVPIKFALPRITLAIVNITFGVLFQPKGYRLLFRVRLVFCEQCFQRFIISDLLSLIKTERCQQLLVLHSVRNGSFILVIQSSPTDKLFGNAWVCIKLIVCCSKLSLFGLLHFNLLSTRKLRRNRVQKLLFEELLSCTNFRNLLGLIFSSAIFMIFSCKWHLVVKTNSSGFSILVAEPFD